MYFWLPLFPSSVYLLSRFIALVKDKSVHDVFGIPNADVEMKRLLFHRFGFYSYVSIGNAHSGIGVGWNYGLLFDQRWEYGQVTSLLG